MMLFILLMLGIITTLLPQTQKFLLLLDVSIQKRTGEKSIKRYLGSVKDPKGEVLYHVMTHFYTVQAAIALHGHSRILFFDKSWKQLAYCEVGAPDGLPNSLTRNSLYFSYAVANNQRHRYQQLIGSALPTQLCVKPNDCYTIYKQ